MTVPEHERPALSAATAEPGGRTDTTTARPARSGLSGDALTAMASLGAPALIVGGWAGAIVLCTGWLADLLTASGRVGRPTALLLALSAAAVYAVIGWVRVVAPTARPTAVNAVATSIALLWLLAGIAAAHGDRALMVAAALAPIWATIGTWAGVRLLVDRRNSSTQHALYRFFDARGRLLYVGRTSQPPARRFAQHGADKWWYREVATRTVTYLPTHSALVDAEADAIRRERPIHNKIRYRGAA